MLGIEAERTPGFKLFLAIVVAGALTMMFLGVLAMRKIIRIRV